MNNLEGLDKLNRRLNAISKGQSILGRIQVAAVKEAKALVPRKTGNLARSIGPGALTRSYAWIHANAAYAAYVELGTKKHDIRPKNKKALFFASQKVTTERFGAGAQLKFNLSGRLSAGSTRKYGNAAFVLTKLVHHPGTKAQAYLVPGAKKALHGAGFKNIIIRQWNGAA